VGGHCSTLAARVASFGGEKFSYAMSLDSPQHHLPPYTTLVGFFMIDYYWCYFLVLFFSLFSLKVHVGHLKFQGSPLSCIYLSIGRQNSYLKFFL